jgi:hypothetical protein
MSGNEFTCGRDKWGSKNNSISPWSIIGLVYRNLTHSIIRRSGVSSVQDIIIYVRPRLVREIEFSKKQILIAFTPFAVGLHACFR